MKITKKQEDWLIQFAKAHNLNNINEALQKLIDIYKTYLPSKTTSFCDKVCKHSNYCIAKLNHKGNHKYHNSLAGLRYNYCDCK